METKGVRIELECEAILRKYSEGSLSDCIRAMEAIIRKGSASDDTAFKEEVRNLIKDFDFFIKHGKGGIRIYPMEDGKILDLEEPLATKYEEYQKDIKKIPSNDRFIFGVDKVDGFKSEFKTASQLKEEK